MSDLYESQRQMRNMRKAAMQRGVVAILDVGSSKIACLVLRFDGTDRAGEVEGVGFHEAPRGTLSHWVVLKDSTIKNYQAVVPTTWNASPRDSDGVSGPYENALKDNPVADPERPLEVPDLLASSTARASVVGERARMESCRCAERRCWISPAPSPASADRSTTRNTVNSPCNTSWRRSMMSSSRSIVAQARARRGSDTLRYADGMTVLRVALAQLNPTVGDLDGNIKLMMEAYDRADASGCDVVAFPELSITGYPP